MLVATRPDFVSSFAKAWKGMGFTGPLLIPQECEGLPPDLPGVERAPFAEQLSSAELFIFEFGLATQTATEPVRAGRQMGPIDKKRLKVAERLFKRAAATEAETRPEEERVPRRFIGVNVIYNKFWHTFTELRRRQHQSLLQPGPGRSAARGRIAQGKVLKFRGRHAL